MARLDKYSYPLPKIDYQSPLSWDETDHFKKMEELQEISDNLPKGEIKGGLISFGVADGSAIYIVVKTKPLTLQHVPFCDGYSVHPALIRGLNKADILDHLDRERRLKEIFAK
ncbi:MAG: hypothetical protein ACXABY_02590 [Candidatus Thorarchaeota archaeon]|jgi:hypothetical protein